MATNNTQPTTPQTTQPNVTSQELAIATKPNAAMTRYGIQPANLDEAYRFATAISRSSLIPAPYQKNPDNCLVTLDLSYRLGCSWLAVMQHVYIISGKPGMDANFAIGLVNQSNDFEPIQYEEDGTDPKDPKYRVRAFSRRKGNPTILYGPWIDWALVKGEGWDSKAGSKWKTMAGQMFFYRAGAWWQKRHCPEKTLGMVTTEELEDSCDPVSGVKHIEVEVKPTNGTRQPFGFNAQLAEAEGVATPADPTQGVDNENPIIEEPNKE